MNRPRVRSRGPGRHRFSAAKAGSGYSDWFLPSKDELNAMYDELKAFGVGGFKNYSYMTSSEISATTKAYQDFATGTQYNDGKINAKDVRACRVFTDEVGAYLLRDVGLAGGLIFYIDSTTYYESSPLEYDQPQLADFSNIRDVLIGTTGTAIGTGQANTTAIINQAGHTDSAAKLCDDLIL